MLDFLDLPSKVIGIRHKKHLFCLPSAGVYPPLRKLCLDQVGHFGSRRYSGSRRWRAGMGGLSLIEAEEGEGWHKPRLLRNVTAPVLGVVGGETS